MTQRPAYAIIAGELRERIRDRRLAPHAPLPSEREIAAEFGVSRMTARHAVGELALQGYVYRRARHGTFVAEPRIPLRVGSFTDEVARSGRSPSAEVLWAQARVPSPAVRHALGLGDGDLIHAFGRLRRANGEPLAVETTAFPAHLCPDLLDGPLDGSLWAVLHDRAGVVPARASAALEVISADEDLCDRLAIARGSPAVALSRHTYDTQGRCFEVARDFYRADRAEFRVEADLLARGPESLPGAGVWTLFASG